MAKQHQQLLFDWNQSSLPLGPPAPLADASLTSPPATGRDLSNDVVPASFDFVNTFPPPRQEAVACGVFGNDVPDAAATAAVHQELGGELSFILRQLKAIDDAKTQGIDPGTGRSPRGIAARERLAEFFGTETERFQRRWDSLIESYANGFGQGAANQFASHLRLVTDATSASDLSSDSPPISLPLESAVVRGVFGMEDEHTPVVPTDEDVRCITVSCAERLLELRERLDAATRRASPLTGSASASTTQTSSGSSSGLPKTGSLSATASGGRPESFAELDRMWCAYHQQLALYAEDFGDAAATRLERWVVSQLRRSEPPPRAASGVGQAAHAAATPARVPAPEEKAAGRLSESARGQSSARPVDETLRVPPRRADPSQTTDPGERRSADSPPVVADPPGQATDGPATSPSAASESQAPATQRQEKLERLHETVDQALEQLAASLEQGRSDGLQAWLKTMSKFHRYSLNNQLLIAWQRPQATFVAGFHAWKKFNRLVNRGEKGIMILAPVTRVVGSVQETDDNGRTQERPVRRIVNTKVVHVFDVGQTTGDPLPEFAVVAGDPAAHAARLKEFVSGRGIKLYFADRLPGGSQGLSEGGRIGIAAGLSPAEEFRTLVHEAAHELLHRGERRQQTTKRSRELEAEAVAFAVCETVGLDAKASSTDYIHLYRGDKAMLLESLQFIRGVATDILAHLLPDDADASSRSPD